MKKCGITILAVILMLQLSACAIKPASPSWQEETEVPQVETEAPQDESVSDPDVEAPSETASGENTADEYKTDWDTFECTYFGDLPVGLLTVPDATVKEVEKYVNERLDLNGSLEVHDVHNAFMSYQVELDQVFSFYGYSGQAVFQFDWDGTLSNIVFEFDTESGITPEVIQQLHHDLEEAFDSERAWLLDEQPDWGAAADCFWSPEYDGTPFKIRLSSMFSDSFPTKNDMEFERTVTRVKMNEDAAGDIYGGKSASITQNGLTIKALYHGGKYPYVSGSITNHSASTVKFIRVKVALLDSSGNVKDTTWTYAVGAEGLAPEETSQWEVFCTEASSIEVSIMD